MIATGGYYGEQREEHPQEGQNLKAYYPQGVYAPAQEDMEPLVTYQGELLQFENFGEPNIIQRWCVVYNGSIWVYNTGNHQSLAFEIPLNSI